MYKLLLVDDEAEIRQGLQEVIPFESLGFTVVGEAGDGVEALRLCEQTEPDLLITDIRMPLMDGLTLYGKAKAILPMLQCIILSGYDDFEFARQAIELKTMSYLLKPISSAEFKEMLVKARVALDEDFSRRRDLKRLREHFRESLPLLRESLLHSLLIGGQPSETILNHADRYELELRANEYVLCLFRPGENLDAEGIADEDLRLFAIRDIVGEILSEHGARNELFSDNGSVAALLMANEVTEAGFAKLVEWAEEARKTARHYLGCTLYVGVSAPCDSLERLPAAHREALTALYQCMLGKEEQVLCIRDIQRNKAGDLQMDDLLLSSLNNGIKTRDLPLARAALDKLMAVAGEAHPSPRAWQAYLMEILMCYLRVISEQALTWDGMDEQMDDLSKSVLRECPGVADAAAMFGQVLEPMLNAMEAGRQTSGKALAAEAERYIQENYMREETSLEQLCMHLHISPSYFSTVFKKETKKTFHQYLTDIRMDKALSLLGATDMKIAQVAESIGLPDHSYFSYCFRRHFGYPPSRARNH